MKNSKGSLSLVTFLALCAAGVFQPTPLVGQDYMEDFMFHAPKVTVSFNLGYGIPTAGSDIFDEATSFYTLDKSDFHAAVIGGGISVYVNDRVDVGFEFSYAKSSAWSMDREYDEELPDGSLIPIEQETLLTRIPLTVSMKYFLMDRGREIGSLSWIPTTWAPYIGIGGGRMYYEWQQSGDFVDFTDLSIFSWDYISEGWAWVGHALGGVQWALSPQWVLTAEGRYSLADADLNRPDYSGYEPIDLSGFQGSLGFGIRF